MLVLDFTKMTTLERDALRAAARRENADDLAATAETHLETQVAAMVKAAVDFYVSDQLPDLRGLALKYLNTDAATREQLLAILEDAQPEESAEIQPSGGGATEQA